jgi:pilus assembly protein Flp/PilA
MLYNIGAVCRALPTVLHDVLLQGYSASSRVARTKEGGALMVFSPREEGQGLVEYALILLFIAIVVVAIMLIFGPSVGNLYSTVVNNWPF